jgi:uncharacterized protein YjiS (DUF1127 family)
MAAPMRLKVTSNVRKLVGEMRADRALTRAGEAALASRSINRAGERARTAAARKIVGRYRLKYRAVLELLQLWKASPDRLVLEIRVRGRPLSVARFSPKATRTGGVTVDIKGARKTVRGGFERQLRSKTGDEYSVVFKRVGAGRYPIKAVKTVDMPGVFAREEVVALLEATANDVFEREFVRQLERKLGEKTR